MSVLSVVRQLRRALGFAVFVALASAGEGWAADKPNIVYIVEIGRAHV